jgi:hypothetical protein
MSMLKGGTGARHKLINKIQYCILYFKVIAFYLAFINDLFLSLFCSFNVNIIVPANVFYVSAHLRNNKNVPKIVRFFYS